MVLEVRERDGKEALRSWLQRAEIDGGEWPGTTRAGPPGLVSMRLARSGSG